MFIDLKKRDAMAWFSAVVQDVRSRSNGLRESCLAVLWSLQKISDDPSDDVGSFSQREPIWIGFTKEFENRQRHWDEVGRVSGLSSYPLQHSPSVPRVDSHEFQVLAMKSPAFHQHFFRRRLPGIVEAS